MDTAERVKVIQGLRSGPAFDQHADAFCVLMTSTPAELHEQEQRFAVVREGKFDLMISVHHRQMRGVYSHAFMADQTGLRGRYDFYLIPLAHEILASAPRSLLSFLIDSSGFFSVEGQELITDPSSYQRSFVRNSVMTFAIAGLQRALTVQVPE